MFSNYKQCLLMLNLVSVNKVWMSRKLHCAISQAERTAAFNKKFINNDRWKDYL